MKSDDSAERMCRWIKSDPLRWRLLGAVRSLNLPDCWIAAGFVRDAVWSILHGDFPDFAGDVDVIWFEAGDVSAERDQAIEVRLRRLSPGIDWSVKNQARMHTVNGDPPYASSGDAMRFWPETATSVAIRRTWHDDCEVLAPLGLDDLLTLKLRPSGKFRDAKHAIFESRMRSKNWLGRFPLLKIVG